VEVRIKHGTLRLRTLALTLGKNPQPTSVRVELNGQAVPSDFKMVENGLRVTLGREAELGENQSLSVTIT
jgi:hypothetical protein